MEEIWSLETDLQNNGNLLFKIKQNYVNGEGLERLVWEQLDTPMEKKVKNKKGLEAERKGVSEEEKEEENNTAVYWSSIFSHTHAHRSQT